MWDMSGNGICNLTETTSYLPPEEVEIVNKSIPDTVGILRIKGVTGYSPNDIDSELINKFYRYAGRLKEEGNTVKTLIFVLPQFCIRGYDMRQTYHLNAHRDLERSQIMYQTNSQQLESLSLVHEFLSGNNLSEGKSGYFPLGRVYKANEKFFDYLIKHTDESYRNLVDNIYIVTSSYYEDNQVTTLKSMHIILKGIYKVLGIDNSLNLKKWIELYRRSGAKQYLETLIETQKNEKTRLSREIDNIKSRMTEYFRQLTPIDFFLRDQEGVLGKIQEELDKCENIRGVKSAYIDQHGSFHVFTDHIYIKQPTTQVTIPGEDEDDDFGEGGSDDIVIKAGGLKNLYWDIGKLHITVKKNGNTFIVCSTRQVKGFCGRLVGHPHVIDTDGSVCLGEISTIVYELLNKHEYASLAGLLVNFAKSVNLSDEAGQSVRRWPVTQLNPS